MKIILTEKQLNRVKLIIESEDKIKIFLSKYEYVNDKVNKLYNKLTFSTLAEILEGEKDLPIYINKLEQLKEIIITHYDNVRNYFETIPDGEFYNNDYFNNMDNKIDNMYNLIIYKKIDPLLELINTLLNIAKTDIENNFKDIKPHKLI